MTRIQTRLTWVIALFAVLLAPLGIEGLRADDGRIPIYKQSSITAPGHYVVTRDFSYTSGNGVFIQANNVTLDLDGHTITGPACVSGEAAVQINSIVATRGIVIRNGRLMSGCYGITAFSTNRVSVRIQHVEVGGPGLQGISIVALDFAEVTTCYVHDVGTIYGINLRGQTGSFNGIISDNIVERVGATGILLDGLAAGQVRRNVVTSFGSISAAADGIRLLADFLTWGAGGNLVEGNTVTALPGGTDDDGIRADDTSPNNLILNNVVKGCRYGIFSYGDWTRIERNVVSNNTIHGIRAGSGVVGSFIHVEENQTQANLGAGGCGIQLDNGNSHVSRNNNVRGNTVAGVCNATLGTNVDGGGNIP